MIERQPSLFRNSNFGPPKLHHPQNPPNPETQISRYLTVQIQVQILVWIEFVPRNMSFWIWWILGL